MPCQDIPHGDVGKVESPLLHVGGNGPKGQTFNPQLDHAFDGALFLADGLEALAVLLVAEGDRAAKVAVLVPQLGLGFGDPLASPVTLELSDGREDGQQELGALLVSL